MIIINFSKFNDKKNFFQIYLKIFSEIYKASKYYIK